MISKESILCSYGKVARIFVYFLYFGDSRVVFFCGMYRYFRLSFEFYASGLRFLQVAFISLTPCLYTGERMTLLSRCTALPYQRNLLLSY